MGSPKPLRGKAESRPELTFGERQEELRMRSVETDCGCKTLKLLRQLVG
jgi:hypothetical protein